jgi:hypothetical protein
VDKIYYTCQLAQYLRDMPMFLTRANLRVLLVSSVKIALINVFFIVGQQESGTRKKAYTLVSNHIIIAKMYLVNELFSGQSLAAVAKTTQTRLCCS